MCPQLSSHGQAQTSGLAGLCNVWSLFKAFTEALKGNLNELPHRTEALHGLLDSHVDLDAPSLN